MPVEIDGFAVLGAMAARPELFKPLQGEAQKAAKALVTKALKDKALTAEALAATAQAIGVEPFGLIADGLSPADIKSVLGKVDKVNDTIKDAPAADQRRHLLALAHGSAKPAVKTPSARPAQRATRPPTAPAAPKPALERSGNSKAMRATNKSKPKSGPTP